MSFTGMPRLPGVNKLRIAAVIVTVIIIIVILVEAVVTVQAGYRGVVL
jgi:regulator of protease activity HflC (stomatin/prohibitin superfamily)